MSANKNYKKKDIKTSVNKAKAVADDINEPLWKKQSPQQIQRFQIITILLLTFLVYSNTLFLQYTLDDRLVITDNTYTKKGIHGFKDILFSDSFDGFYGKNKNLLAGGRYRPLAQMTFAIEYSLLGKNPFVSHLGNLIIFEIICLLIFFLLQNLFQNYKSKFWYLSIPFVTTILYALHPIHTEAVSNTKGRDELFCMLFSLSTIILFLKSLDTKKIKFMIFYTLTFFLAIMSKETGVTFLAILPLTVYFFTKHNFKKSVVAYLPLALVIVVFVFIRYKALGFFLNSGTIENELLNNPYLNVDFSRKYATIFYTMAIYLKLLIFPHPLTHDYYPFQIPYIEWLDLRAFLPLLIFGFFGYFSIKGFFKKNVFAYWILFYLITFSIVSNLFMNIGAFMNERFVFIPSLGYCFAFAFLLTEGVRKYFKNESLSHQISLYALIIILAGYSLKTFTRNFTWKDDFTLFTTDVNTSSNSAKCTVSAGGMLIEQSEKEKDSLKKREYLAKAVDYLQKGTSLHKTYIAGWVLLGNAYLYLDMYPESFICYDNCLNINSTHNDALINMLSLGQNSNVKKRYNVAYKAFKRLNPLNPNKFEYITGLAETYENIGRPDSAIIILNQYASKFPNDYKVYNRLGQVWGQRLNNIDMALENLNKAQKLKPNDASILENLGVAYGFKGLYKESAESLEKALILKPKNPQIYVNLAKSYQAMKRLDKSKECAELADKYLKEEKNKK